jgi:hypothetical protein
MSVSDLLSYYILHLHLLTTNRSIILHASSPAPTWHLMPDARNAENRDATLELTSQTSLQRALRGPRGLEHRRRRGGGDGIRDEGRRRGALSVLGAWGGGGGAQARRVSGSRGGSAMA